MKSMKKLVLVGLVLLASVMVLVGCQMEPQGLKIYKFSTKPVILTDYKSPNNTDDSWTYVAFGDWPQTIKDNSVIIDENNTIQMGMFTYYLGNDGNYYVKITVKPYKDEYTYLYSDNKTKVKEGETVYFKVEPIVWRVLNSKDKDYSKSNNALLLAENILVGGIPYYVSGSERTIPDINLIGGGPNTVFANNYQYSTIRAWLNGGYADRDVQETNYENEGFFQTAFTGDAQTWIVTTTVDNTAQSTNPDGAPEEWNEGKNICASGTTEDKIFLLSVQEITNENYGFPAYTEAGTESHRIRIATDYAIATGAEQSYALDVGGSWWLRSPHYINYLAHFISNIGGIDGYNSAVDICKRGVVPALCIQLQ